MSNNNRSPWFIYKFEIIEATEILKVETKFHFFLPETGIA